MTEPKPLPTTATVYADECARRLRANPRDPDGLFARAAFHGASEQFAKAIAILDELAKVAPTYPGLWRFKARLYEELGDEHKAALCLNAAASNGDG